MARSAVLLCSGVLTTLFVTGVAFAQAPAAPFDAPPARVARGTAAAALLRGNPADLPGIVAEYLRGVGHSDATVASIVLTGRDTNARTGVTYLRFAQRVGGVDVYGTYVRASVDAAGALTSVIENLVAARAVAVGDLEGGPGRALAIGLQAVHGAAATPPGLVRQQGNRSVFARTAFFHREPTVTRVAVPVGANGLRPGYLVETWSEQGNQLHHTLVGGDGAVLGIEARTASDSYYVFAKSPEAGMQQTVSGPAPNTVSPSGWLSSSAQKTTNIVGNNVQAYLDTDANNAPDAGGTAVTNGAFGAAWDGGTQPGTTSNRAAATQNLFYLNNVTHDRLYGHGFTEAAGNFQDNNFSRGGAGSDPVLAEVQDGSGTDNANFATPADGSKPRMQMYIWKGLGNAEVVVGSRRYLAQLGSFSPALSTTGITAGLVVANDGTSPGADACERFPRNVSLTGKIVIADRGTCDFTLKASNVQRAGGAALIVVNNTDGAIFAMGGTGTSQIPAVMVSSADGAALKTATGNATLRATAAPPIDRDSSLDSDIVYHEYGHGLTWRMIGSMSGAMSGAIGEGMSDVLALLFNNDNDRVGEYAASDPLGIRTQPYANYTRTYKDFGGTEVHLDGEIYGAIGWRLRNNFLAAGLTVDTLLDYLVDGMNETEPAPAIEDMRDGILQAIRNTGEALDGPHQCQVWEAFAHYGVGVGAQAATSRRGKLTITESKTLPANCQ